MVPLLRRLRLQDMTKMLPLGWDHPNIIWPDPQTGYGVADIKTQEDFQLEGRLLAHCLGTKRAETWNVLHRMFSIRDAEGVPHATILTTRNPQATPYGRCRDLGTGYPMLIDGEKLFVLQVRGREDALARIEFHRIARRFYLAHKGVLVTSDKALDGMCEADSDKDVDYHYEYKYDPRPFERRFNWTWEDLERWEEEHAAGRVY